MPLNSSKAATTQYRTAITSSLARLVRDMKADIVATAHWLRHPVNNLTKLYRDAPGIITFALSDKVSTHEREKSLPWALIRYFIISRVVFLLLCRTRHLAEVGDAMHLMDMNLIRTDFWHSLWYMHSQPPLFNILTWLVIKLSPFGQSWMVILPLFSAMGLALCLMLYFVQVRLSVAPRWAAAIAFLFSISANTLYYEFYFMYAYPVVVALLGAVYFLTRLLEGKNASWYSLGLFSCLAVACLFHSFFHLIFLATAFIGLLIFARGLRPQIILGALLPLLVVTGIYAKNDYHVGHFAASTWGGWTVADITYYYPLNKTEKAELIKEGILSPLALTSTFDALENYPTSSWQHPPTGIPLLDDVRKSNGLVNYHNLGVINVSDQAGKDALAIIEYHPEVYWRGIQTAAYLFLLAPSEWFNTRIKDHTFYWDWLWSFVTTGKVGWSGKSQSLMLRERFKTEDYIPRNLWEYINYNGWYNFPWFTPFILLGIMSGGLFLAIRQTYRKDKQALSYWGLLYIVGYVTTAAILLDIGENQRYRYYMSPELAVLFGCLSAYILRTKSSEARSKA
jgi:4-amino-4-deoxy-L-arabinose transferase-like glycosyltransferase